jgi:hypothetical protein
MTLKILTSKRELGIKTTEVAKTGGNHLAFNILFLSGDAALFMGIILPLFYMYVEKKQMDDKDYLAAFTSMLMLFTSSPF